MDQRTRIALQIAGGLVVVLCIYLLSLWVIGGDQLVPDVNTMRQPRLQVKIMDGFGMGNAMSDHSWSTINQDAKSFMSLKRSFNRRGGAQFSYSFWMQLTDTTPSNVAGRTILLRGDKNVYAWVEQTAADSTFNTITTTTGHQDVLVKSPRIRFGPTYDSFVVELNTVNDPDVQIAFSPEVESTYDGELVTKKGDPSLRHNALSLTKGKWSMYTFTFEDQVAISDFESGIMVRFYINDTLYQTTRLPGTMRQNYGDLFLFPSIPTAASTAAAASADVFHHAASTLPKTNPYFNGSLGNLSYFNYALSIKDVGELFNYGPPRYPAKDMSSSVGSDPLYLSEYNRLDVYNT